MTERCLRALQARRSALHVQWEALLRAAPVNSPLGNPDTLVHLIARTIEQVFHELEHPSPRRRQAPLPHDFCRCGHNPLVAYFHTATMAFQTILAQCADEVPVSRDDADEMKRTLTRIARCEIMTFCGLCLRQPESSPKACDTHDHHTPTA